MFDAPDANLAQIFLILFLGMRSSMMSSRVAYDQLPWPEQYARLCDWESQIKLLLFRRLLSPPHLRDPSVEKLGKQILQRVKHHKKVLHDAILVANGLPFLD